MAVARIIVYGRKGPTGFAYPRGGCTAANILYQDTTENSEENIRIVSTLAKQKHRTGSARQNAEMPESVEITDKTSEYFIRQRTKVTLEKRIHKKFQLSQIGYVNGTNGNKINREAFLLFLIDSYYELSSFTLANLSVATIKKKNGRANDVRTSVMATSTWN